MSSWRSLKRLIAVVACAGSVLVGAPTSSAADPAVKLSLELQAVASGDLTLDVPWLHVATSPLVRVIVVAAPDDPSLTALRQYLVAVGGTVYYRYVSLPAVAAMLPASRLLELAARDDVISVSPNRVVTRTTSVLQFTSGVAGTSGPRVSYAGNVDGTGVGIAILDSGIDWNHQSVGTTLQGIKGPTRVRQVLDFAQAGASLLDTSWIGGIDLSASMSTTLDGTRFSSTLLMLQRPRLSLPDPYGHGTHVAAIAAGNASYQLPDTTGIAPNADLYDVRVLDEHGVGNIANVIAGIDWVIQHASALHIRVMNLSLAARSTESFITDPLARAARAAVASGVVVVAAAGNAGMTDDGREVYGAVGSPGHDPSVITVGAVNLHGTMMRRDDTVTRFSSRGPTRGRTIVDGEPWVDNLLKPDIVAPGNRIVGALASDIFGTRATWNALVTTYPQLALVPGASQAPNRTLMELSGTSVAAPVVSGAVALLL